MAESSLEPPRYIRTDVMTSVPVDPHVTAIRPVAPRHASAHAHTVGHPIVQSMEPGEDWRWCHVDQNFV